MNADDTLLAYLWDPSAEADPAVVRMETRLSATRFDPAAAPLDLSRLPAARAARPMWRRPVPALAIAASLLILAGFGLWQWRWSWPEGRAWTVRSSSFDTSLRVGQPISIPEPDRAVANIGRIGTMRIGGGTALELRATRGRRHRVRMTEGDVHVRVWAPPLSIVIETPVGEVIDLGCEFRLSVRGNTASVQVLSGWVQIENGFDEMLVPAGASTEVTGSRAPGAPVFDDAAPAFREGIRAFERNGDQMALARALPLARPRDVYTLLRFADSNRSIAEPVLTRAAELDPPPQGITIASILRGNRNNLWRWANAQPLPSPKSEWWKNWRDALPFWLSAR